MEGNRTIPYLFTCGEISEKEYKKWLLDETGEYIPKLISEE